jgi:hypothetical protein
VDPILTNLFRTHPVRPFVEIFGEFLNSVQISLSGEGRIVTKMQFLLHPFA